MQNETIFRELEYLRPEMTDALIKLICVPAIAPENMGNGELQKAAELLQILSNVGFDKIERWDAEDLRVSCGKRPNIIAYKQGETDEERLWIITHLDVVPPGDENLWTITKPFEPLSKDNRVYGRGSEDNGQSIIASIYAVSALKRLGIKPKRTVALAFVADEEQGSMKGIRHLLQLGLFRKNDLVIVPDGGHPNGDFIEIAEKSLLWFKIHTMGKQVHASLPNKGLNAHRVGITVAIALDRLLHKKYSKRDRCFDVPESTFEITKKERNVDAVNIIPGEDTVYFDCRILPRYNVDEVLKDIGDVVLSFEKKTGAKITVEVLQKQASPMVNPHHKAVKLLKRAIKKTKPVPIKVGGIGGGTCAAFFRQVGIPALVWSTIDGVAHQPNEYSKVDNMVNDAKVFALLAIS